MSIIFPPPPPDVYYIDYPLKDVISCEICAKVPHENSQRRQKAIFKAKSRRINYALHLKKKHSALMKIRCSVCGRVSEKSSRSAWRDSKSHYQREHADIVVAGEAKQLPVLDHDSESGYDSFLTRKRKAVQESSPKRKPVKVAKSCQPSAAVVLPGVLPNVPAASQKASKAEEPKLCLQSKSIIISAMGQLFDICGDTIADLPNHSTPKKTQQKQQASEVVA